MSDANNGVDDYRVKNQMNGASGNAGYSQNGQAYGQQYGQSYSQQYGQSAQHHDQMQQQPQFASPYGQPVQQQMNQQQMGQPFGQQQFAQPSQYRQPHGQSVQSRMSQLPPYGQPHMGRPYGRPPYGGAPFAARAGYANGRFNSSYIEEQARKFSFRWNAKEIISAIIVVVIAAIFASIIIRYGRDFYSNVSQIITSVFKYDDEYGVLPGILICVVYTFPLVIVVSFAQVLRKRFFTIAGGFVVAASVFLTLFFDLYTSETDNFIYGFLRCLLQCATIIVFFVFIEILQWAITKYKPENDLKYMLVNFISVIIFCIVNAIFDIYANGWSIFEASSMLKLLLDMVMFFIVLVPMLVILPCLVSLLSKAVKFTKFLNPEREMMQL